MTSVPVPLLPSARPTAPAVGPQPGTQNGISWTASTPAPIPSVFANNDSGEMANAFANAADTAANQALAKTQTEAAQTQADNAILAPLSNAIRINPSLANTPALLNKIAPILARRGITLPKNSDGTVDATQLHDLISPAPTITPAEADNISNGINGKEKLLGTGNYTPSMFLADILAARRRLSEGGQDPGQLDSYLDPSHTRLNDSFVKDYVGKKASDEIQHLRDLGIHLSNEDSLRKVIEDDHRAEFDKTLQFKKLNLSAQQQHWASQVAVQNAHLAQGAQNLQARWASIDDARERFNQSRNTLTLQAYKASLEQAQQLLDKKTSELEAVRKTILATDPSTLTDQNQKQQFDLLVRQAGDLQQFITEKGADLAAQRSAAAQGITNVITNITGNPSTTQQGLNVGAYAGTDGRTKKPVFQDTSGQSPSGYVYQDGTPVPK